MTRGIDVDSPAPCSRVAPPAHEMGLVGPSKDLIPQDALRRWLRELPDWVILRNEEDLFGNLERGGDLDVLVGDLKVAERTLIRHLGVPVRIIRSSYVTGYSYDWGHVDLLPTIEWRGACYARTDAVLSGRRSSLHDRFVPSIAHEALISWLTSLLFGGFFKERYAVQIRRAADIDGPAFRQMLMEVAGTKLGTRLWDAAVDGRAEISAEWTQSLRRAVWSRACMKSPLRTIYRYCRFVIGELRLRLQPPVPCIAILGADHDARSALVQDVVRRFAACPYATVKACDWRPGLLARSQSAGPHAGLHRRAPPVHACSSLEQLMVAADVLAHYWTRLVHLRAKGYILAFDRVYFDAAVGYDRRQGQATPQLARLLQGLHPKPDLIFHIDSDSGTGYGMRHDQPLARAFGTPRMAFRRQRFAAHVLPGDAPRSELVDEIERVIRTWLFNRSMSSLVAQNLSPTPAVASAEANVASALLSRGDRTQ